MIRWLARYEITVDSGTEARRFRFASRAHVRWAVWFGTGVLGGTGTKVTARDRWTGRRFA